MSQMFKSLALPVFRQGYSVIPITPHDAQTDNAGKVPAFKDWARMEITETSISGWLDRYARYGIGIRTWQTPAVDIDCLDDEAAAHMRSFVENTVGVAPARVGRAPKTLLLYRTTEPFTKVKSHTWLDEWGQENAVEILGAGQQFVAYGIHPKTVKPYEWVTPEHPALINALTGLEAISLFQARDIADEFDRYAEAMGWERHTKRHPSRGTYAEGDEGRSAEIDPDDWVDIDDIKEKWEGTVEELAELMLTVPPAEDYDEWYPVLAALKDAEREPDEFRDIALEWSARASNFDADAFDHKWEKGGFRRAGNNVFSIKSLMRKAEVMRMENDIEVEIVPQFAEAQTLKEWDLAAERLRETPVFGTLREHAVVVACEHYKRITGKTIPATTKRFALSVDYTQFEPPEWVRPWVFIQTENIFVHRTSSLRLVPHAFNNTMARHTKAMNVTPEVFVTQLCPIPMIDGTMYYPAAHGDMPGNIWVPTSSVEGEDFFEFQGKTFLNTFRPSTVPELPEKQTKAGRMAAEVVINYFQTQFPDNAEYVRVMDWLAWVINNPTKRINYALLILGGQGSGKSIIKKFMTYMLGAENVGTVSNQIIHKSFSGWQAGNVLKVIEEISVSGHRYDVMNILKEPISNETLFIERKYRDGVEEVNTASWMAYTNDIAALPVTRLDRRWLIVQSQFKTKEHVQAYLADHPEFYKDFERAFIRHAGQIKLFMSKWKYSEDFDPTGHAPVTLSQEDMMYTAFDDFTDAVLNAVDSAEYAGITPEIIHSHGLTVHIPRDLRPNMRHIASRLADIGYRRLGPGRVQARLNGRMGTIYARDPDKWRYPNNTDRFDIQRIQRHLEEHANEIETIDVIDAWR